MRVTITRCELVPGTPHPEEPESVTTDFIDNLGNPSQVTTYPGGAVSYFSGDHYEVTATVEDGDSPSWELSSEFEASYPPDEIPKAMLQLAKQHPASVVGTVIEG